MTCACCGTPTPALERIQPLGIQQGISPDRPYLVLWLCSGAREIDRELLRFGIIARAPWSCQNIRFLPLVRTTFDLRQRAYEAERLYFARMGWI